MIPAKVNVEIDEKSIQEYVERQIDKKLNQQLLLVDINKLSEITSMSIRFLENEILSDPRVKIHERRKNRKRWWIYEPTIKAILEIIDEW